MADTPNVEVEQVEPSEVQGKESTIFGVSVRGLIALTLILTLCGLACFSVDVKEPLYTLVSTVVAFYFGHQTAVKQIK